MRRSGEQATSAAPVDWLVRSLLGRFDGSFDAVAIEAEVNLEFARYSQAPVRQYIPILVERAVEARLRQAEHPIPRRSDTEALAINGTAPSHTREGGQHDDDLARQRR